MKYLKLYLDDASYMADKQRDLGDLDVWVASTQSENHVYYSSEIDNSLCFTAMENNASVQMRLYDMDASPNVLQAKSFSYKKNDDVELTPSVQMKLSDEGVTSAGWQAKSFYYKKNDDVEWTELVFENNTTSLITLYEGEKLYVMSDSYNSCAVHGDGTIDECKYYYFNISGGKISASGNIMSLLNFTPVLPNYAFYSLFKDCTSLVSAPDLPVTTLTEGCYKSMFANCSSLTQVPELPATTLAASCYSGMFTNCSSLVSVPALPATTLADSCYYQMFLGCSSLVSAPELPATTLASYCYNEMFNGCSKLNYIKALFTTTPGSTYTYNWVSGVSSTGTFVKSKDATWDVTGAYGIPSGWTVTTV